MISEEKIDRIWRLGGEMPKDWDWKYFKSIKPCFLETFVERLFQQTDKRPGDSFCDLGSGTGFPSAVFAALGFKAYLVDKSRKALDYSKAYFERVQKELGAFEYAPVFAEVDMTSEEFATYVFNDGQKINEIDVLFCRAGSDVLFFKKVICNIKEIKKGCIWLDYARLYENRELDTTCFTAIDKSEYCSLLVNR